MTKSRDIKDISEVLDLERRHRRPGKAVLVVLILLAIAGGVLWKFRSPGNAKAVADFKTESVRKERLKVIVSATGTLKSVNQVDAYPDKTFPAQITQVRFAPQTENDVVTYECLLKVDNFDLLLRPGMTATADILVKDEPDALLVPNAGLRFTPSHGPNSSSGSARQGVDRNDKSSIVSIMNPRLERFWYLSF